MIFIVAGIKIALTAIGKTDKSEERLGGNEFWIKYTKQSRWVAPNDPLLSSGSKLPLAVSQP